MNVVTDSGLLFVAAEQTRILSYFIPALGPAPRWCSFLDNLAEELEEEKAGVYDDYKFVCIERIERCWMKNIPNKWIFDITYNFCYFMTTTNFSIFL